MEHTKKKIHFIALGGSVMHSLAIALHRQGIEVTGSDDHFEEPSKSQLSKEGLLPSQTGWYPEKITKDLDAIILGMHARKDNPELLKAQELGIKIYSYPEYVFTQSQDKQRIVVCGSHGKNTTALMIIHVLNYHKRKFDYVVGAISDGLETTVKLTEDAPVIVILGDEYSSSPLDKTPKFLHYHHHIGIVTGIAWDYMNIYPTFDEYVAQFEHFADASPKGGMLVFSESDDLSSVICKKEREDVQRVEYSAHKSEIINGETFLIADGKKLKVNFFGKHNMKNVSAAKTVCSKLAISNEMFYEAITSFKGAAGRLELLSTNKKSYIYKDIAHAPSKWKASTNAVKKQYPDKQLVSVLELDTFSSLNKDFLNQYRDTFKSADVAVVFYDQKTLSAKNLAPIPPQDLEKAFDNTNLKVFTDSNSLESFLISQEWNNKNLLMMSSGAFGGLDLIQLSRKITG